MITIKTEINEDAQRALTKRIQRIYLALIVISSIGLLAYVVFSVIFIDADYLEYLLLFAIPFGFSLIFYITINTNIKKMEENKFVNEYEFENEYFNVKTSRDGDEIGTQKIYYKDIVKIKEDNEYIFIYINRTNAYIVKKANASLENLQRLKVMLNIE